MVGPRGPLGVTALFDWLGELFAAGRLAEIATLHVFPCPLESDGELRVMRDAAEFEAVFAHIRSALVEGGVVELAPHVLAIELPRDDRFRVWLRWVCRFADGSEVEADPTVYYLARQPGGLAIEMMAFVRLPVSVEPVPARATVH